MKFVFNYTRVTNRAESIVAGSLIISSSFNHEFVVTYTNFSHLRISVIPREIKGNSYAKFWWVNKCIVVNVKMVNCVLPKMWTVVLDSLTHSLPE